MEGQVDQKLLTKQSIFDKMKGEYDFTSFPGRFKYYYDIQHPRMFFISDSTILAHKRELEQIK